MQNSKNSLILESHFLNTSRNIPCITQAQCLPRLKHHTNAPCQQLQPLTMTMRRPPTTYTARQFFFRSDCRSAQIANHYISLSDQRQVYIRAHRPSRLRKRAQVAPPTDILRSMRARAQRPPPPPSLPASLTRSCRTTASPSTAGSRTGSSACSSRTNDGRTTSPRRCAPCSTTGSGRN